MRRNVLTIMVPTSLVGVAAGLLHHEEFFNRWTAIVDVALISTACIATASLASARYSASLALESIAVKPTVSVCMISYNHGKFIAQAIESILSQESRLPD